MTEQYNTVMFAIEDQEKGHNIPDLFMGKTEAGEELFSKAVFPKEGQATLLAEHMSEKSGTPGRFTVCTVEVWKPVDIELYVRSRIRDHEKEKGPKIQLLS